MHGACHWPVAKKKCGKFAAMAVLDGISPSDPAAGYCPLHAEMVLRNRANLALLNEKRFTEESLTPSASIRRPASRRAGEPLGAFAAARPAVSSIDRGITRA